MLVDSMGSMRAASLVDQWVVTWVDSKVDYWVDLMELWLVVTKVGM